MKNESIGFVAIITALLAQIGEAVTWINDNITTISAYVAILGSVAWIISSYYKAKLDNANTKKIEMEMKKQGVVESLPPTGK